MRMEAHKFHWTIAMSQDGRWLAYCTDTADVHVQETVPNGSVHTLNTVQIGCTSSLGFSHDSRWLACGYKGEIITWEISTNIKRVFNNNLANHDEISAVAFAEDGEWVASGSDLGRVDLWEIATGTMKESFLTDERNITAVAFSHATMQLAYSSIERTMVWDINTNLSQAIDSEREETGHCTSWRMALY